MNYLVVRFATLGSVAMLVPVITGIAKQHANDTFVLLTEKHHEAMFAELPNVKLCVIDNTQNMLQLSRQLLKEYCIDAVIDLQDSFASRRLRFCFRLHKKPVFIIKKQRARRRSLIRKGYKRSAPLLTEFQLYANAFESAGMKTDFHFHPLTIHQPSSDMPVKPADEQWIGVAPFAKYQTNMMPYILTKALLGYLSNRPNTRIFLFGAGAVESEVLNQWELVFDNTHNVAGKLTLDGELALMRQLDIMVCMDSANQHLSSLVGLPALTIWCGTHPYAGFYGWKQPDDYIIQKPLDCRPCTLHGAKKCRKKTFECQEIDVNEIISKLENILKH